MTKLSPVKFSIILQEIQELKESIEYIEGYFTSATLSEATMLDYLSIEMLHLMSDIDEIHHYIESLKKCRRTAEDAAPVIALP